MSKKAKRRGHKTGANQPKAVILNRRAGFDYQLGDNLTVGLVLTGAETKAARLGHVGLRGAYVVPRLNRATSKTELYLINASFSLPTYAARSSGQSATTVDSSARKILAKRREIDKLAAARTAGLTIVPTKLLLSGRFIKLVIAIGRGKKRYDKRQAIRQRDIERDNAKQGY
jgi:SsrA-binding protein